MPTEKIVAKPGTRTETDNKSGTFDGAELNPTVTVSCKQLAEMLHIPAGLTVVDAWTTAYDDAITFEYGEKEV
jgi:hypothetical protein